MSDYKELKEFYPTPPKLIAKMLEGVDINSIKYMLEPSAGKGDIALFTEIAVDCYADYAFEYMRDDRELSKEALQKKIIKAYAIPEFKKNCEKSSLYRRKIT